MSVHISVLCLCETEGSELARYEVTTSVEVLRNKQDLAQRRERKGAQENTMQAYVVVTETELMLALRSRLQAPSLIVPQS